jgi:hypothetical protein
MNDVDAAAQHAARAEAEAAADARATRLLLRIGIVAIVSLLVWIGVVVASFGH